MPRQLTMLILCALLGACASSDKKKTTPEHKDVNAEGKKEDEEKKQSWSEAWRLICHAERLAGASSKASRQERAALVAEWITVNVTNKKARYWWISFGSLKKREREGFFRRDAKTAGVDPCPLAELLFRSHPASAPTKSAN